MRIKLNYLTPLLATGAAAVASAPTAATANQPVSIAAALKQSIAAIGFGSAVLTAPLFAALVTTTADGAARPDHVVISANNQDERERDWHQMYDEPVYIPHVDNTVHQSR